MTKKLRVSLLPLMVLFVGSLQAQSVFLGRVENKVVIGKMANNRNLAFGCKNIFSEILQDKGLSVVGDSIKADIVFTAEIMYFDVNRTKRNISVFHSDKEETLVVIKGKLSTSNGKKIKEAVAEESSEEISTSTIITDSGSDKINQQALSQSIKKTCESLINKLFK